MIDQNYLKSVLNYDPISGLFTWKERPDVPKYINTRCSGKIAGTISKFGYIQIIINKKHYYAHRLAWLFVYCVWPKDQIDHINHDKTDNKIINLRETTNSENQQNQIKGMSNNTSGFLGVYYKKSNNKFCSSIRINYKLHHIGYFNTAEEAYKAYLNAKHDLHSFSTL